MALFVSGEGYLGLQCFNGLLKMSLAKPVTIGEAWNRLYLVSTCCLPQSHTQALSQILNNQNSVLLYDLHLLYTGY